MISCTEFIPSYSELFKYLEELGGYDAVLTYWNENSDTNLAEMLGKKVDGKGIRGCWDYWSKSLNEEACDFRMELDEVEGTFSIDMRKCPSRGMLNSLTYMEPYYDYCKHCEVIYARQLEKYGILPHISDWSRIDKAQCYLSFKIKPEFVPADCKGEKLSMDVKASDNEYFHRDFHIGGSTGIDYLGKKFGEAHVIEYLTRFAKAYYKPLIEKIRENGLVAMKENIEHVYELEKAPDNVKCTLTDNELHVVVSECPAVKYMKETGHTPSKWYVETTRTVYKTVAEESGYGFEMISYNDDNGAAEYRFFVK